VDIDGPLEVPQEPAAGSDERPAKAESSKPPPPPVTNGAVDMSTFRPTFVMRKNRVTSSNADDEKEKKKKKKG
jgi:hypothetical protein